MTAKVLLSFLRRDNPSGSPDKAYTQWGYTLYRTAYGPGTDRQWAMLVETIRTVVRVSLECLQRKAEFERQREAEFGRDDEEAHAAQILLGLFRLDPRSDYDTLHGKDMDELDALRDLYQTNPFSWLYASTNMVLDDGEEDRPSPDRFLLADREVLKRVDDGIFHVKFVDAGFYERDYNPVNTRVERTYYGWMQLPVVAIISLLGYTENSFEELAPDILPNQPVPLWTGPSPGKARRVADSYSRPPPGPTVRVS